MTLDQGQDITLTFNTHISFTLIIVCIYHLSGHMLRPNLLYKELLNISDCLMPFSVAASLIRFR